jgi:hypothetical protein
MILFQERNRMKKIALIFALLTLAACQTPQQRRTEAAVTCIICMLKAQITEANLKACPSQVQLKDEKKENAYKVFKLMSEITFKDVHDSVVKDSVAKIRKEKSCSKSVERIQSNNIMYEFLAVK